MATRVYIDGNEPRLVTSKAGFDASPSLDNINKTFDSNWFTGTGIRWQLRGLRPFLASGITSWRVNFPQVLNHVPRVNAFMSLKWNNRSVFFEGAPTGIAWPGPPPDSKGFVMTREFQQIYTVDTAGVNMSIPPFSGEIRNGSDVYYHIVVYGA